MDISCFVFNQLSISIRVSFDRVPLLFSSRKLSQWEEDMRKPVSTGSDKAVQRARIEYIFVIFVLVVLYVLVKVRSWTDLVITLILNN